MRYTAKEQLAAMRRVAAQHTRAEFRSMTRAEYNAAVETAVSEIRAERQARR